MSKVPAPRTPDNDPAAFAAALQDWFAAEGKDYPWRRTRDPYAVLVSEIMLQQTQVATVLGRRYFENWMAKFPDPATLAAASEEAVLKAWEGLGYYRRARNLQKAAQHIVAEHGGVFPTAPTEILGLPGVGRYTAGAVSTFALGLPEPVVDANIARVLARLFDFHEEIDSTKGQRQLWTWAAELVPAEGARAYNSGLMELGQTHCRAGEPDCVACPVADFCISTDPEVLPKKRPKKKTVFQEERVGFFQKGGEVLLEQETGARRQGLWKLPLAEDYDGWEDWPELERSKYSITHHRVTLIALAPPPSVRSEISETLRWFGADEIEQIGMPSPYRRALRRLVAGASFRNRPSGAGE